MAFTLQSNVIGATDMTAVATSAPGISPLPSAVLEPQLGEIRQGWDSNGLGSGEFIYLQGNASNTVGAVVSYNALTGVTTPWAGTSITGIPLAVSLAAPLAGQYGWFQVQGNTVINCTGTVTAGDSGYFSATAAIKSAVATGKQVLNLVAASANGAAVGKVTLLTTQAVYTINRPFAQGAIT